MPIVFPDYTQVQIGIPLRVMASPMTVFKKLGSLSFEKLCFPEGLAFRRFRLIHFKVGRRRIEVKEDPFLN
jgi:hypothetical protein